MLKNLLLLSLTSIIFFSCVTKKKYDDLNRKKSKLEVKSAEEEQMNKVLTAQNQSLQEQMDTYMDQLKGLQNDTTELGKLYKELSNEYSNLSKISAADAQQLQQKLEEVMTLRKSLVEKNSRMQEDQSKIDRLEQNLQEREKRVAELEKKIADQQAAVNALKKKINEALLSFNEDELTVEMKNGKVYVSLSNELLFKSGSYNVDPKGISAINKLADVLKSHNDLEVIVEGHTDDVPFSGRGELTDNWDLSVKRATSITRLLQKRGVNPQQIAASGRSQYNPKIDEKTKEARSKNRRIEIIISPNLDPLFDIINE